MIAPRARHLTTSLVVFVASLAACSDGDDAPPASVGPAPVETRDDAAAAPEDAGPLTRHCEGLALLGDVVPEIELPGRAPPALGGTLVPGTYDLVEAYTYTGVVPTVEEDASAPDAGDGPSGPRLTGQAVQATIVVTAETLRRIEARGSADAPALGAARAAASAYRVDGTQLVLRPLCPERGPELQAAYSAVGQESLALLVDERRREVFRKRPE